MLFQRRRLWASIKQALAQCLEFTRIAVKCDPRAQTAHPTVILHNK